jgi:hypothetical protein
MLVLMSYKFGANASNLVLIFGGGGVNSFTFSGEYFPFKKYTILLAT